MASDDCGAANTPRFGARGVRIGSVCPRHGCLGQVNSWDDLAMCCHIAIRRSAGEVVLTCGGWISPEPHLRFPLERR